MRFPLYFQFLYAGMMYLLFVLCLLAYTSSARATFALDTSWQGSLSSGSVFASRHVYIGDGSSMSRIGSRVVNRDTKLKMAGDDEVRVNCKCNYFDCSLLFLT